MQSIHMVDGVARFVENKAVTYLLNNGGLNLNILALAQLPREDMEQLAQLIGYSVSGFGDLSYASPEVVDAADAVVAAMLERGL